MVCLKGEIMNWDNTDGHHPIEDIKTAIEVTRKNTLNWKDMEVQDG